MKITVYFRFKGNCNEALAFYKDCFGGDLVSLQKFGSVEQFAKTMPAELHEKVLHAEFKSGDLHFYACDGMPDHVENGCCGGASTSSRGDRMIELSLELSSEVEQTTVFDKLACGGSIEMPLQDTFWGARFGMLIDKFGIKWLLNFEKKSKVNY